MNTTKSDSCLKCRHHRNVEGGAHLCAALDKKIYDVETRVLPYSPGIFGTPILCDDGILRVRCEKYEEL